MRWNEDRTMQLLTRVLEIGAGEEIEATLAARDYGLTRFAGNVIHQNMQEENAILSVRLARQGRVGCCATNQLDAEGIRLAVQRAREIAELSQPNPDFDGFSPPLPLGRVRGEVYYPGTAEAGAGQRASLARRLVEKVKDSSYEAAGAVSSGSYASAVATSRGTARLPAGNPLPCPDCGQPPGHGRVWHRLCRMVRARPGAALPRRSGRSGPFHLRPQ